MTINPIPRNSFNPLDLFKKTPAQKLDCQIKTLVKERNCLKFLVHKKTLEIDMLVELKKYIHLEGE